MLLEDILFLVNDSQLVKVIDNDYYDGSEDWVYFCDTADNIAHELTFHGDADRMQVMDIYAHKNVLIICITLD